MPINLAMTGIYTKDGIPPDELYNYIEKLEEDKIGTSSDDFYRDLILNLGLEGQMSKDIAQNQVMLIKQIDERKKGNILCILR